MRQGVACGAKLSTAEDKANKRKGSAAPLKSSESESHAYQTDTVILPPTELEEDSFPLVESPKNDRRKKVTHMLLITNFLSFGSDLSEPTTYR